MSHFEDVIARNTFRQYLRSPNLQAWFRTVADLTHEELMEPIEALQSWPNPTGLKLWTLDMLGSFVGLPRPLILGSDGPQEFFGFRGARGYEPKGFGGGVLADERSIRESLRPLPDTDFRRLLKARMLTLRSNSSLHAIDRAAKALEPLAFQGAQRVTQTAPHEFTLHLAVNDVSMRQVLGQKSVLQRVLPFPVLSQITIEFV